LSSSSKKGFRARRPPGQEYRSKTSTNKNFKSKPKIKGPKEPFDISKRVPQIDFSNIPITDVDDDDVDDDDDSLGGVLNHPQLNIALQMARRDDLDIETQLKMMDYFTSAPGSTEDLVGERRIMALEALEGQDRDALLADMNQMVEKERLDYMELPETEHVNLEELKQADSGGSTRIPHNQLAHGDWYVS
jgi:hypothetical protein